MKAVKLGKKKVRVRDLTPTAEETPPWDDAPVAKKKAKPKGYGNIKPHPDEAKPKKNKAKVIDLSDVETVKRSAKKAVRDYGEAEDVDEQDVIDDSASVKFKKRMQRVAKKVSNTNKAYNSPATQEAVTREALASVLRQIPKAEQNYKASGNERAAYAYSNLINNARELMADLRSMSSTDALADQVLAEAVRPAFMQMVNYLITETSTMRTKINGSNNIDSLRRQLNEQLNKMLEEVGEYAQETLDKASENTRKSLKG